MIKYIFATDEPLPIKNAKKAKPQKIGVALEKIAAEHNGRLKPEDVVNAARDQAHPLHQYFEWDDKIAAESYRLDQARGIIRLVRVEDTNMSDGTARAFISISDDIGVSYRTIGEVKGSADLQMAVLKAADRDLEAFQMRYRNLVEICEAAQTARDLVKARREKAEKQPRA